LECEKKYLRRRFTFLWMEKEEKIFNREDIAFLNQLSNTLEESELKLEEAYDKKDYESFNRIKKMMLQIQKKISEIIVA